MDLAATLQDRIPPFARHLGIRFLPESDRDRVCAEIVVREDLCTNTGAIHGGAIMAFADTLGAVATTANLPSDTWTTTLESKTNFFAPGLLSATLRGEALPLHRGRRTQVWQTSIRDAGGRLVAQVTQTQIVLPRTSAPA
jgi:uncharacterized protein (TIGR00369 family)